MGQAGHPRGERECCARLPPRRCAVYRPRRERLPAAGRRSEASACRHERGRREHCRRAHRGNGHHQQTSALAWGGRMTTKHTPATPLPQNKPAGMTQRDWESTTHRRETTRRANAYPQLVEALKSIAALPQNKPAGMTQRDWESTTHRRETTRRANAYPQLVEALKSIAALD